jgi:two-component system response regulator RstA
MDAPVKQRILLVEDDEKLSRLVQEFLESNGFSVIVERQGNRAPDVILAERPDLVILDLMLPGLDGLSICRKVRPRFDGPILMLTALGDEVDEVVGLEVGADDYMAKPVRPRLLLARIKTLLRRVPQGQGRREGGNEEGEVSVEEPKRIEVGSLKVDAGNRSVFVDDRRVQVTTAEFDLLWLLASHPGEILTRDMICRTLRGIEYDGLDRSIDLRIARLRRKLGDDGRQPQRIKSVRGSGYILVTDQ